MVFSRSGKGEGEGKGREGVPAFSLISIGVIWVWWLFNYGPGGMADGNCTK